MRSFRFEKTAFAPLLRCRRRRVVNRLAGGMRSSRRVVPGPGWEVMSLGSFMTVIAEAAGSFVMFCGQGRRRRCQDRRDCRDASWLPLSSPGLGSTRRSVAIDVRPMRRVARDAAIVAEMYALFAISAFVGSMDNPTCSDKN